MNKLEEVIRSGMLSYFKIQEPGSVDSYALGIAGYLVHEVLVNYLYNEKNVRLDKLVRTTETDLSKEDIVFSEKLGRKLEGAIYKVLIDEASKYK